MTLLEIVQQILSDMDGDQVHSIWDTEESEQVARHVINTYRNLVSNNQWATTKRALTLISRSDDAYPTHIILNDNVKELLFINYNKSKVNDTRKYYSEVKWKHPDDFLRYINHRDNTSPKVEVVVDDSGIELLIRNDKQPEYFTSFNDKDIVFDSYDSAVDDTIQESKIQAQGYVVPELLMNDTAVPDIPPEALALLLEEATSRSQYKVRQFEDLKSETEARRQKITMSRRNWRANGGIKYRDYGKRRNRVRDPNFIRKN